MNLGNIISTLRKAKNYNQTDLATLCGITQTYLSLIESNKKEPTLNTLKTISQHLDIPVPVMFFMALTKDDLPEHKKAAFAVIQPMIKAFLSEVYE